MELCAESHLVRFAVILAALLSSACSTLPRAVIAERELRPQRDQEIYAVSHGWHTGLIVPAVAAERSLPFLRERFDHATAYEFGWGDKGFYQSKTITASLAVKALFWRNGSVMHVVALHEDPASCFPTSEKVRVPLTKRELASLGRFLDSSFQRDSRGRIMRLQHGIYGDSQFYEGRGSYCIVNTCNKWTAKGLKSAGRAITPSAKLTAGSVMANLKRAR